MTLQFPNKSPSFDDVKRTVRFLIKAAALLEKAIAVMRKRITSMPSVSHGNSEGSDQGL